MALSRVVLIENAIVFLVGIELSLYIFSMLPNRPTELLSELVPIICLFQSSMDFIDLLASTLL